MSKKNKKQHFVPAIYLKAWLDKTCPANHAPYVWIFNKDGTNGKKRAPENILAETDFYTVIDKDGQRNLSIEHSLGKLEERFSRIRKCKLSYHRDLDDNEKIDLCIFVAASQIRTKSSEKHHKEQWGNVLRVADDLNDKIKVMPESKKNQLSRMSVSPSNGPKFSYEQIKDLTENPLQNMIGPVIKSVTPVLLKMDMAVFCSENTSFITSDTPCIWYDPESYKKPPLFRGVGLINPSIEITMPISPKQCLLFNWQNINGYISIDSDGVNRMNQRQIAFADKEFVSHENKTNQKWFEKTEMPDDAWEKLHPK